MSLRAMRVVGLFAFGFVAGLIGVSWLSDVSLGDALGPRAQLANAREAGVNSCVPEAKEDEVFFTGCGGIF